jgi:hypothetical protein
VVRAIGIDDRLRIGRWLDFFGRRRGLLRKDRHRHEARE